jgi:hypothetical protein
MWCVEVDIWSQEEGSDKGMEKKMHKEDLHDYNLVFHQLFD